ncbi:MAG: hypothetical protein ABSE68_01590 [Minisyncoccia bacterium]
MKKIFILIPAVIMVFGLTSLPARAEENQTVQKALDNAKQYLDDLVTAKDDNSVDDVGLRVETFRQVLDLSSAEAKDLEFKLLTVTKEDVFEAWKKQAMNGLTEALVYFDSQKQAVSDGKDVSLGQIKQIAQDFKSWRDENYLPLTGQIQDFMLIKQEAKSVQTAQSRLQKINNDLKSIKRAIFSSADKINGLLANSTESINKADELNNQATKLFIDLYVSTSTAATSTLTVATSTEEISSVVLDNSSSTASSSALKDQSPIVSIKDLVGSSLLKIKEAYQGFIDISNLVRKLLK